MNSGRVLRILHSNDLHGKLDAGRARFLQQVRSQHDLYFDSGDAVRSGNLSVPLGPEEVWQHLAAAGISAQVPGNRESHLWPPAVHAKFKGCRHTVLCANWKDRDGEPLWTPSIILEAGGLKVGVFGVMVAMVTPRMKTQAASAYLWDPPLDAAKACCGQLAGQVDCLIALTHIGLAQDRRLAAMCPELDLILGGHSHDVLDPVEVVDGVPILQAGSHGRWLGSCTWSPEGGLQESRLIPWEVLPARPH